MAASSASAAPETSAAAPRGAAVPTQPRAGSAERAAASSASKRPRRDPSCETAATVQSLMCRADLLASRCRYKEALALVEEALRLDPQKADLFHGKGQCLLQLGELEEASRCLEAALRIEPQHKFAARSKAIVLVKRQLWSEAAACLRRLLDSNPGDSELKAELATCLTQEGIQLKSSGRSNPELFRDALSVFEGHANAYFQLGVQYSEAGNNAEARDMYKKAVQLQPAYTEAWNNLGVACRELGEPEQAVEAYTMALKGKQSCTKTRENMTISLLELGCQSLKLKDFKKASMLLKKALTFNSKNADVFFNLAVMYAECQKWEKAKVHYELALHFDPAHANACNNLGVIHRRLGDMDSAIACFEKALEADPKMNLANKNLGAVYGPMGRMAESIRLTRLALETSPDDAEAYNNLALLYRDQGDVDICLEHLDACLKLEAENPHACSNRLMTLNYVSEMPRDEVFEAHRSFGEQLERRVPVQYTSWKPREGLLRIGYISPDFYRHSVSYFIHAALRHHDPAFAHITCYSDVALEDEKTQLFRSFVPRWRSISGLSDEKVAAMIHEDGIDVLVELTGHTGNNRMSMLARKPAPVVVSWIGYPHTTGMSRVDYRISDEKVDPPDAPGLTTEKLVYLPECFLCYAPPENAPSVSLRPAQETYGCITFGCFNTLAKISPLTVRVWCHLLHKVPDARLFLKSKALQCPEVQARFRNYFTSRGIDGSRVDLSGLQAHTGGHLSMYSLVDVALDTAPYAGTTTTCEALFMGVPVVSLRGKGIHAQAVGASLLSAVQLGDLVAGSEDEYVQIASSLARNPTRLAAFRAGLRPRMLKSVLCDGPRHTARLERLLEGLAATIRDGGDADGGSCEEASLAEVQ